MEYSLSLIHISISSSDAPQLFSICSSMGISVRLWVSPLFWNDWAISLSSSQRATEQAVAEDSSARIFIFSPPRTSDGAHPPP